jgi:acyl transferase domain-containing protein
MNDKRNLLQESMATIQRLQARLAASENASREPIAIIGAGCRYPGDVESPDDLWRVVRDGVDAVSEVPADRWDADAYYDPDPDAPNKMVTRRAGFLGQVDQFDSKFFGISPREAQTMDPQQRLLLETAHEALESAGLAVDQLAGSATGVFVGITTSDYARMLQAGGPENSDVYSATGGALNAAAGRISFTLAFKGPAWPSTPPARRRWSPRTWPAKACVPARATWRWPAGSTLSSRPTPWSCSPNGA